MGEFAEQVKNAKIAGPHTPKFTRGDWVAFAQREDIDLEDKRLVWAGIFFDNLLTYLRSEMRFVDLPFQPSALARLVIGLDTWNYCLITAQGNETFPIPKPGEVPILMWPSQQELQVPTLPGQFFYPDELITGGGDELKRLLVDLQALPKNPTLQTEYDATRKDIDNLSREFNKAIMYSCAVEYWLDCVGHSYGVVHHPDGIAHVPFDPDQEISRIVSTYRRLHLYLQDKFYIYDQWRYRLPNAAKKKLCEIPLVGQVHLNHDRIESIELNQNSKVLTWAIMTIADKVVLQRGYYQKLLHEPLPKLHNFTLNEIINGWRVLQSLAQAIFDEVSPLVSTGLWPF